MTDNKKKLLDIFFLKKILNLKTAKFIYTISLFAC